MDYELGEVLRDKWGLEWVVAENDRLFPNEFPGRFLIYRKANLLSRGDRQPIEKAADMVRTGEHDDAGRGVYFD